MGTSNSFGRHSQSKLQVVLFSFFSLGMVGMQWETGSNQNRTIGKWHGIRKGKNDTIESFTVTDEHTHLPCAPDYTTSLVIR